jgi:hypothetical protein
LSKTGLHSLSKVPVLHILRHLRFSVKSFLKSLHPSFRTHGRDYGPQNGLTWNLIFKYSTRNYIQNSDSFTRQRIVGTS